MRKVTKSIALLFILNLLTVTAALAQQPICPGDPDDGTFNPDGCPLDTYVWVLAIAALIFGAVYLHRQQKAQNGLKSL